MSPSDTLAKRLRIHFVIMRNNLYIWILHDRGTFIAYTREPWETRIQANRGKCCLRSSTLRGTAGDTIFYPRFISIASDARLQIPGTTSRRHVSIKLNMCRDRGRNSPVVVYIAPRPIPAGTTQLSNNWKCMGSIRRVGRCAKGKRQTIRDVRMRHAAPAFVAKIVKSR